MIDREMPLHFLQPLLGHIVETATLQALAIHFSKCSLANAPRQRRGWPPSTALRNKATTRVNNDSVVRRWFIGDGDKVSKSDILGGCLGFCVNGVSSNSVKSVLQTGWKSGSARLSSPGLALSISC